MNRPSTQNNIQYAANRNIKILNFFAVKYDKNKAEKIKLR